MDIRNIDELLREYINKRISFEDDFKTHWLDVSLRYVGLHILTIAISCVVYIIFGKLWTAFSTWLILSVTMTLSSRDVGRQIAITAHRLKQVQIELLILNTLVTMYIKSHNDSTNT